jgi:hypothetical protein
VKDDLTADGYEIWHDKDRISGGDAFAAEIEFCLVPMEIGIRIRSSLSRPDASYYRCDDSPCDVQERAYATRVLRWGNSPTWGTPTARMASWSCQGWRTKFMAVPMRLWRQA